MKKKSTEEICKEIMEIYNQAEPEVKERINTYMACGSAYGLEFLNEMYEYIDNKEYGKYLVALEKWKKRLEEDKKGALK